MTFDVTISVNVMRLSFDPVRGRRTFYAKLAIGSHTFWLMRWDTERCLYPNKPKPFAFSRDRLMCWTAGHRT